MSKTNSKERVPKQPMTNAERQRKYMERKRGPREPRKPPMTSVERQRKYIQRKRALMALKKEPKADAVVQNITTQPGPSKDAIQACSSKTESKPFPYKCYPRHFKAHEEFKNKFLLNNFGAVCCVCDRLWFERDLKPPPIASKVIFVKVFPDINVETAPCCLPCRTALGRYKIPALSKSNGFVYPPRPDHLPELDLVTERLISPLLAFSQIRRLRHGYDQKDVVGQVINIPVSAKTMVSKLPRELDDDLCINVNIERKNIYKSSKLTGLVRKNAIKAWLEYLVNTPLYKLYGIKIKESFFSDDESLIDPSAREELSEAIDCEESLFAQQQTLLWNEDRYLRNSTDQASTFQNDEYFNEHSEELAFPSIYLGQIQKFNENITVSMITSSELLRADRRSVTPHHLLYMAMKTMRMRITESLKVASSFIGKSTKLTRDQIESKDFISRCLENNLAFLRSIPNSPYYWTQCTRDLFAIIRQFGKPTILLTMKANEIAWPKLLQLLYKLKNNGAEINTDALNDLHYIDKAALVNSDPVTCAIYFNRLVETVTTILKTRRSNPFGENYATHFFKRFEFDSRGSPQVHLFLWLNDAPSDPTSEKTDNAAAFIDRLVSVSEDDASGLIDLQRHKHVFACYKNVANTKSERCQFEAPFMPCRRTVILKPMAETDSRQPTYRKLYALLWQELEENDYKDIDHFFSDNNIVSEELYLDILRAGISRPKVFLKREPSEKWIIPFNPFILNVLGSSTDMHFITEEYSCAASVVKYVSMTNRGISDLRQKIISTMNDHPEFDNGEISRKLSVDVLNSVEITSQEAAWYLLRLPITSNSVDLIYLPTVWPEERQQVRKSNKQLGLDDNQKETSDLEQASWFAAYKNRPSILENRTLAETAAYYNVSKNEWKRRTYPRVIRYRNYDISDANGLEYKREMVTLHIPFRNEETDILAGMRFLHLYDKHKLLIEKRKSEFESNFDVGKTLEICRQMCAVDEDPDIATINDLTSLLTTSTTKPDSSTELDAGASEDAKVDHGMDTSVDNCEE